MREKVLTVLVIVSLALSVFNLVLTLRATPSLSNILTPVDSETARADNFETLLKQYPNVTMFRYTVLEAIFKYSGHDASFVNLNDTATFLEYLFKTETRSLSRIENTFYFTTHLSRVGYYRP